MSDKLYLLGGADEDGELSPQVFLASLNTLSTHQLNWQSAPNTPWYGSGPVVLHNKLLTVGGSQEIRTSEVCIFNPSTGQWKRLTNIPTARSGATAVGVADNVIIIGGINNNKEFCNAVWIGVFE